MLWSEVEMLPESDRPRAGSRWRAGGNRAQASGDRLTEGKGFHGISLLMTCPALTPLPSGTLAGS